MIKAGSYVIYQAYGKKEYEIVKRIAEDGERAFVWYHFGCTATGTKLSDLSLSKNKMKEHDMIHSGCAQCLS